METLIKEELFDLIRYSYVPDGDVVIYITSKNFDGGALEIANKVCAGISFYELRVDNWDDNLTPWKADPKMKGRVFGGKGRGLLEKIKDSVIPALGNFRKIYIAGYSLAGLFSLWSLYESNLFSGCACCSGSLWYPGWVEYVNNNNPCSDSRIYLSVGNREKNSKNEYMKLVEQAYAATLVAIDKDSTITTHFDLNIGGHFNDASERVVKGISWLTYKD